MVAMTVLVAVSITDTVSAPMVGDDVGAGAVGADRHRVRVERRRRSVATTVLVAVSITDTVSSKVLVT